MKRLSIPSFAAAMMTALLAGCGRDDVQVYHVATNETVVPQAAAAAAVRSTAMPASMPGDLPAPDHSGLPKLKYTLPDGWKEKALTQMRVASFTATVDGKEADVSVIPLSGLAGGNLANVNRWRGQVGLQPVDEAAMTKSAEAVTIAGQAGELFDLDGSSVGNDNAQRILGAILHSDDTAWYFKMTGDSALVDKLKPGFIAFIKSVDFDKQAAPSALDMSQLPASHPAIPGLATAAPAADSGKHPAWNVPAGWQPGPLAQFLVAKYNINGEGGTTASVNVSQLSGDGGGLAANINRWCGQLGLAAMSADEIAKLPTIDAAGGKAVIADISGTDARSGKPARLVGAVVPVGGDTWFYKLMGDGSVVGAQKDAFLKFVESVKY